MLIVHLGHACIDYHPLLGLCATSNSNPPFHGLVHQLCAHPFPFSTLNSMCVHACVYFGHTTIDYQTTTWPTSWASYHWSLGVLCAHLEWPGWALPSLLYWMSLHAFLLQHGCQCMLSPAEQARTIPYHHLSSPETIFITQPSIFEWQT